MLEPTYEAGVGAWCYKWQKHEDKLCPSGDFDIREDGRFFINLSGADSLDDVAEFAKFLLRCCEHAKNRVRE